MMSMDLFNTQLVAQQLPPGKELAGIADGEGSRSLGHSQGHDAVESNDQEFLKTLERLTDNQKSYQGSPPSDKDTSTIRKDNPRNSGDNDAISDSLDTANDCIGADSQIAAENNIVAIVQNIDPANINVFDQLKQLGLEFLLTNGNGRSDEPAIRGEKTKSGVTLERPTTDSLKFSSVDLSKLEKLLIHLQADNNPKLSDDDRRFVQLIRTITGNDNPNSAKDPVSQNLFQDTSGKSQEFQIVAQNLRDAIKTIHEDQLINEKTTVADLLKKNGLQLTQPGGASQNMELVASKANISGGTTEGEKNLLARLDAGRISKDINGGKNFMAQNLTEVHRLSSNPSKAPVPEIGPNVQKQILQNDQPSNPVAKSESTPFVFQTPSHVNHSNTEQTGRMMNLNPSPVSADKVVAQVLPAESDAKDGGLLFNQSQNEVKTPETKLVNSETEGLQKDFRSQTVNQIVQKAVLHFNGGQHEVKLDLKPDFLGHIRMQIIAESQQVTVRIFTEYPMVKELIENNLHQLKSDLQNHGLEIDELDVSVEDDADQHVADRNLAAQDKIKPPAQSDQSEDSHSEDAAANSTMPLRNGGSTRIDYFA